MTSSRGAAVYAKSSALAVEKCSIPKWNPRNTAGTAPAAGLAIISSNDSNDWNEEKTLCAPDVARHLPQSGQMPSIAAMPVGRKHTGKVLRINQVSKMNTWHYRNRIQNNVPRIFGSGYRKSGAVYL